MIAASSYEAVKPRLILDLIDYPDKAGLEWQSQDNGLPGSGQCEFCCQKSDAGVRQFLLCHLHEVLLEHMDQESLHVTHLYVRHT